MSRYALCQEILIKKKRLHHGPDFYPGPILRMLVGGSVPLYFGAGRAAGWSLNTSLNGLKIAVNQPGSNIQARKCLHMCR
jgi:hypothetical protein